jgi:hypothetical protein
MKASILLIIALLLSQISSAQTATRATVSRAVQQQAHSAPAQIPAKPAPVSASQKTPVATAGYVQSTAQPYVQSLKKLLDYEALVTKIRLQIAKADAANELANWQVREAIIKPAMDALFKQPTQGKAGLPMAAGMSSSANQLGKNAAKVTTKGIVATAAAESPFFQVALQKAELDSELALARQMSDELWASIGPSTSSYLVARLFFAYMANVFLEETQTDFRTKVTGVDSDPACAGDLSAMIHPMLLSGLDKDLTTHSQLSYDVIRQYYCLSDNQAITADYYLHDAFEKARVKAVARNVFDKAKRQILEPLFQLALTTFDENKYHYSEWHKFFQEFGKDYVTYYKDGITKQLGIMFRNQFNGTVENFTLSDGGTYETKQYAGFDPTAIEKTVDTTPFGVRFSLLRDLFCSPEFVQDKLAAIEAEGVLMVNFGTFMSNVGDLVGGIGTGRLGFGHTALFGMPNTYGACLTGGGGGGSGGKGGMACSLGPTGMGAGGGKGGGAIHGDSKQCTIPPWAIKASTCTACTGNGSELPEMGQTATPQEFGGKDMAVMAFKLGADCGSNNPLSYDPEGGGFGAPKDENLENYKEQAHADWDKNKDKVYDEYEKQTGKELTAEQKAGADEFVHDAINSSTSGIVGGGSGGTTGGKSTISVDEDGNAVSGKITWQTAYVNGLGDPGSAGLSNEQIRTHEAGHIAIGYLGGKKEWNDGFHHDVINGAGYLPAPDADTYNCAVSGEQITGPRGSTNYCSSMTNDQYEKICSSPIAMCYDQTHKNAEDADAVDASQGGITPPGPTAQQVGASNGEGGTGNECGPDKLCDPDSAWTDPDSLEYMPCTTMFTNKERLWDPSPQNFAKFPAFIREMYTEDKYSPGGQFNKAATVQTNKAPSGQWQQGQAQDGQQQPGDDDD